MKNKNNYNYFINNMLRLSKGLSNLRYKRPVFRRNYTIKIKEKVCNDMDLKAIGAIIGLTYGTYKTVRHSRRLPQGLTGVFGTIWLIAGGSCLGPIIIFPIAAIEAGLYLK